MVHITLTDEDIDAPPTNGDNPHVGGESGTASKFVEGAFDPEMVAKDDHEMDIFAFVMTQYSLRAALKKFGKGAEDAAMAEMKQLHVMDCWDVEDPAKLSREERARALPSLIFIKEKRDGKLKGRSCADGSGQREYISKEEAASPTVMNESTFLTAGIAAYERRYMRTGDVPGAFVNTNHEGRASRAHDQAGAKSISQIRNLGCKREAGAIRATPKSPIWTSSLGTAVLSKIQKRARSIWI